jgi:hypothetical protein
MSASADEPQLICGKCGKRLQGVGRVADRCSACLLELARDEKELPDYSKITTIQPGKRGADPLASWQSCETVGAPFFATDPVMNEEQPGGIIFLLHFREFRIVRTPK